MYCQLDQLLDMVYSYRRARALAYLYRHKELLEDKNYNCAYRLLRMNHIKKYAKYTVNDAVKYAESEIKEILDNYENEGVEKYKLDVDYIAALSKEHNIAEKLDKLNLIEF